MTRTYHDRREVGMLHASFNQEKLFQFSQITKNGDP